MKYVFILIKNIKFVFNFVYFQNLTLTTVCLLSVADLVVYDLNHQIALDEEMSKCTKNICSQSNGYSIILNILLEVTSLYCDVLS